MAEDKAKVKELEAKIATLEEIGETEAANRYKTQLAKLKGGEIVAEEEKEEGLVFSIPASKEEWEKASSKFAAVGTYRSEYGMPYWKDKGKTIAFPFTITAEGVENSKEGEYFVGVGPDAIWKLKEILASASVPVAFVKGKDGQKHPQFEAAAVAGKEFESVWTEQVDSRSAAEGGKGTKYTKPTSALPLGSTPESLGI